MAGLWAVGATATLAALAAYFVLGGFLYVGGLPAEVALSPAAYAVFGLAALFNPLYAAILPILLPVRNYCSAILAPMPAHHQCEAFSQCRRDWGACVW